MPTLQKIWIKPARLLPMKSVDRAELETGRGLVGNADQGGRRQVTLISQEQWDTVQSELDAEIPPETRRANLLVAGLTFHGCRGRLLQIGEARVRIHGETKPCNQMEEAHPGLQDALYPEWRGGAYGEVIEGAEVEVGAEVRWLD